MSTHTLLEVDDSIIMKSFILPENVRDRDIQERTKQYDSKPFFIVQPMPGACIKTKTDSGEKVFLNICTSDKIPEPKDLSDAELLELLSEETPSFTIPMSIGSERLESDKGGALCSTYDIAINTKYFEKCRKKKMFFRFTICVMMDGVSNKFNKALNAEDYVVLKNLKVMGKLQQHRIENREPRTQQSQSIKPLIEEVSSLPQNVSPGCDTNYKYVLLRQPSKGPPNRMIGLFDMPKQVSGDDVAVLLGTDRVVVAAEKTGPTYDISVPYCLKPGSAKCSLDKDIQMLRLDVSVDG